MATSKRSRYSTTQQQSYYYNEYWDNLFRDTPYWDQYTGIINQYDMLAPSNWWSQITGQAEVNQYEHDSARNQALQALLMQMKADEYNSPTQEVARNAEAGLNSDILGTDGVAQQADYGATGRQHPMMLSNPIDFLSLVGSAVSGAFGMVGQIQDMQTKSLMNDKERLAIHSLLNGISIETLVNGDYSKDKDEESFGNPILDAAVNFGYDTGSKQLDRRLHDRTKRFMDSLPHQIATYKAMGDRASARKNLFDITSSAGYSEDDAAFLGTLASKMSEIQLLTLELDQLEKQTNSLYQVRQDNWDMSYLSGLDAQTAADANNVQNETLSNVDPVAAADATNSTNRETSRANKLRSQIFNAEKGLINSLRDAASNGNAFATAILFKLMSGQSTGISDGITAGANSAATAAKIAKMFVK